MRAWQVLAIDTGQMEQREMPPPEPGPGEVRVKVHAAALNFSDLLMARGQYQVRPAAPFIPGQEIAGVIDRVGGGASRWRVGGRVASKVLWGGFAEFAIVRENMAIAVPDGMDFSTAAAWPVVYTTSHIALHARAGLKKGETILVHAAAGGVGMAALQLAVNAGAQVIATAGSADKLALCKSRGATAAFDYRSDSWVDGVREVTNQRGVDVIFDPVGGPIADISLKLIAYRGRYLIVGFASGRIQDIKANRLLLKNASALGVYWNHDKDQDVIEQANADILAQWQKGQLAIDVGQTYSFDQLPDALADLAERRTVGKSVLLVC